MKRNIICDYVLSFRLERIKEAYGNGNGWNSFYILAIVPAIMLAGFYKSMRLEGIVLFCVTELPMLFGMFASPLQQMTLPKILFLCPWDEKERKKYLTKRYCFKIGVPVLLDVIAMTALVCLKQTDLFAAFCAVVVAVCLMLNTGFHPIGARRLKAYEAAAQIVSIVSAYLVPYYVAEESRMWEKIGLAVLIAALLIPLTIRVMRDWRSETEAALSYERTYGVREK